MSHKSMRQLLWAGVAALLCLGTFLVSSCNTVDAGGHTYLKVHVDSSWVAFDSVQVLLDHGDGKPLERIFGGKIKATSDLNQLQVDGYDGAKVTIVIRAFNGKTVAREENRKYDGSSQKTIEVVVVIDTGTIVKPQQGKLVANAGPDTSALVSTDMILSGTAKDSLGKIVKQEWKIGEGIFTVTPDGKVAFKTPATAGDVKVVFRVTDDSNLVAQDTAVVHVLPKDSIPSDTTKDALHLSVTPKDTLISIRDSAAFVAVAKNDNAKITKAEWDLDGDGTVDITQNPDLNSATLTAGFRFAKAGTYHPTLTIQGAKGASLKVSVIVRVNEDRPVANAGKDTTVLTDAQVALKGTPKDSLGTIVKQEWSIAGGAYAVTADGKASFKASSAPGDIKAVYRVTDDDSLMADDTVIVHVVSPLIANLTQLTLQGCALAPAFSPDSLTYGCAAPYGTASLIVTAKAQGTMTLNGKALEDGKAGDPVPFASGKALIVIAVTNGTSTKSYTVNATIAAASANNALSALTLSGGTLAPVFASDQAVYTASVASTVASVSITATVADANASLTVQDANTVSGTAVNIPLITGPNVVTMVVTSQSGLKRTYGVTVTRQSGEASLNSLKVAPGAFAPAFAAGTLNYTMSIGSATASLTLTAVPQDSGKAFMTLNGATLVSGKATVVATTTPLTTITIVVSAEDKAVTKTYVLKVTKVDDVPPAAPVVALGDFATPDRPTWTWTSGGGGNGNFRYKLDDANLATGATATTALTFSAPADMAGGAHTLYVQEVDSAGNWSASGSSVATLTVLKTIADYPLDGHASDTSAGANADLTLQNDPFLSQGVFINGISGSTSDPNYSDAWTPILSGFVTSNFSAEIDFKAALLPGTTIPILVGGSSFRWIGGLLDQDGKISLLYNNSVTVKGTATYVAGEWHTLKLEYIGGIAKVYLDGILSASVTAALVFSTDHNFGVSNPSNGTIFKGNVRNLRVTSSGVKIAQYPLSGSNKDITKTQTVMNLTNAPYQVPGPGITCAGVYPNSPTVGNNASTPTLAAMDLTDFAVTADFSISALPAARIPILVAGASSRFMGALIEPAGTLTLLYNNTLVQATTANCSLTAKHTVMFRYSATSQVAAIYLDGVLAGSKSIPTLSAGTDKNVSTANFSNGTVFKGTLYRIKVDSK